MSVKYVIQARENSQRFHGKCFVKINEKWIIQYIIDACKKSKHYKTGSIHFVIPTNDLQLRDLASGYKIYTSTDDNCLQGYLAIGDNHDIIVRLTADSPLIETSEIDKNIDKVIEGYEYASNEITTFGNACEAFTKEALVKYCDISTDKVHVTPSIRNYSNRWIPSLMVDYPESIKTIEEYINDETM